MFLGIEASAVRINRALLWYGGYVDVVYDFKASAVRVSLGPEGGASYAGVDGGLVLELDRQGVHVGSALRPMLTAGVATTFLRFEHLFGSTPMPGRTELGMLLKLPVYGPAVGGQSCRGCQKRWRNGSSGDPRQIWAGWTRGSEDTGVLLSGEGCDAGLVVTTQFPPGIDLSSSGA